MAEADVSNRTSIRSGSNLTEDGESVSRQRVDLTHEDESISIRRDIEFCELYFKVIDKQLDRGDYEENVKQAKDHFAEIRSKTDKWCRFKKENELEQINLLKQSFYYRMMCIYSNATCISSAMAYYFGNFLNQNLKSLKGLLHKNVLRICSIGGGLPSDVVALIKVLESSIYIKDDAQIHITVIDVDKKWKKPCIAILQSTENFSKEKWKVDFIALDPSSQSISPKIGSAIKEADFVSLIKFLTQLDGQDTEMKRNLFQKLSQLVSPGSVLFLMDDAIPEVMQVFQGYLGRLHGHNLLFEVACQLHTLQLPAVKKLHNLYSKHLITTGMCNTSIKLFCRAWIRTEERFLHTGSHLESPDPQLKKVEKSLDEKRAWQCELRLLCRQLSDNKIPESTIPWKEYFVTEMKNQEFSQRKIQKMMNNAEKDLHLRKMYAKQLMLASYQDFLEETREMRDARKESDEAHKEEKRKKFHEMKERANSERQTYESCIRNLLKNLERNRRTKAKPKKTF